MPDLGQDQRHGRSRNGANHRETIEVINTAPQTLIVGAEAAARNIAYRIRPAQGAGVARPGVFWLAGFNSVMTSTKVTTLDAWAEGAGRGLTRFDYSGTGLSGGRFAEGTISRWLEESLAVFALTKSPQIIVGSSMGGWLALLLARALADKARLAGMVLIAPAVDFTQALMWARFSKEVRAEIETKGFWRRPSAYSDDPYVISRALIEDGRNNLLFGTALRSYCPVHILQGMQDDDVPWSHAMTLVEHLASDPVTITLVKDGDHRLSRPQDLARLVTMVEAM